MNNVTLPVASAHVIKKYPVSKYEDHISRILRTTITFSTNHNRNILIKTKRNNSKITTKKTLNGEKSYERIWPRA